MLSFLLDVNYAPRDYLDCGFIWRPAFGTAMTPSHYVKAYAVLAVPGRLEIRE